MKNRSIMPKILFVSMLMTGYFLPVFIRAETNNNLDLSQGTFYIRSQTSSGIKLSTEIGISSRLNGSGAFYFEQNEFYGGFDTWLDAHIKGDIGDAFSYSFEIGVGLLSARRPYLGEYQYKVDKNETVTIYGNPLSYFPYSYHGRWDGFIFPLDEMNAGGPSGWPDTSSVGFSLLCEIFGSAFDDTLFWSMGRKKHEWAAMDQGSSLVLNEAAQPFFGFELSFQPFSWFGFSSLTGILEYFNANGIQTSSRTFQNAFSLSLAYFDFANFIHIDFGTSSVWPKRFELGYLFPLIDNMLYQNNIGDFDNIGFFGNLKLKKSGLGFIWGSFFIDEVNFEENFFILDREMYAWQCGLEVLLPGLSFASLDLSYTKIEPYCYTHQKTSVPWYASPMEEAYTNHGYGLGYYLPPNSDEIKLRFQTIPTSGTVVKAQFQMIRHGADYGKRAVDGSSYLSELAEFNRSSDLRLRKFFLHDGAYQWSHIIKGGITHSLRTLPIELSLEAGMVFSYWTDIDGNPNDGFSYPYHIIDTESYPKRTGVIASLGIRIYK
ncbi:MAG: hypothetical protein LBD96_10785 [Treponema sp.]|nr:hypothetical protein [Treponema sp.]